MVGSGIAGCLLVAACGSPPTAAPAGSKAAGSEGDSAAGASALEEVYAAVEGLTGQERFDTLIELAAEEEGDLSLYTSTNLDESGPITDAFTDLTEFDVDLYRASSSSVLQRILQENDADFAGADVVATNGPEMTILDTEGLLLPLESPVTEDIVEFGVFDNWAAVYLNVFVSAWNTDAISGDEVPTSWEEVLTGYDNRLAMELGDWDWFATLVGHMIEEEGMSEEEAVELFREAAREGVVVDGHTVMAELLAAGEFDITSSSYQHRIPQLAKDGAPVAWEPPVEPAIVRPNGIGIHADTDVPAKALLLVEYELGPEAQSQLVEFDRSPSNDTVEGGFPDDVEVLLVDVEALLDEREKWETLYEEVIRESGSGVIEG